MTLRQKAEVAGHHALQEALRRPFDAVAGPKKVLQIDRLEVDLGQLEPDAGFDVETLADAVATALEAALAAPSQEDTLPPLDAVDDAARVEVAWHSTRALREQALLAYLQTGALPETAPERGLSDLVAALFESAITTPFATKVFALIRDHPAVALRVMHVLHTLDILVLARVWSELQLLPVDVTVGAIRDLVEAADTSGGLMLIARQFRAMLQGKKPDRVAPPSSRTTKAREVLDRARMTPKVPGTEDGGPDDSHAPLSDLDFLTLPDAGMVLIAPYLPRLFDRLDLDPSGETVITAARLIHWLAHGHDAAQEPDLLMARVLLDVPPLIALIDDTPLSEAMQRGAESLLDAVISHWPQLGKTSRAGLQETFLQRPGLLRQTERGPEITVETRGVDVLLSGISWSYSPLYLPWRRQPIRVDWT